MQQLMAKNEAIWVPWCNLDELQLVPGDIGRACTWFREKAGDPWFREKYGEEVKLIIVNPKNEALALAEAGDLKIETCPGCLTFEIWMSASTGDNFETRNSVEISSSGAFQNSENSRGRPRKSLPVEKMHRLKAAGAGVREIATRLSVSPSTVSRALTRAREHGGEC